MIVLACVNKAAFIYLQALGKAFISMALSMFREIVLGVLLPIVLPMKFGLEGILYSMPIADALTFIATIFVLIYMYRELSTKSIE